MAGYNLIFTPEAREDVKSAERYYNDQLPDLGKRFKNDVKLQLLLLKQNPFTRAIRYDNVRFALLDHFLYSIHYTLDESEIFVYAVICDYRNPQKYWLHGTKQE